MARTPAFIAITCFLFPVFTNAQDGKLDLTFDLGTTTNDIINKWEYLPDGKIVICGKFSAYKGIKRDKIARLNADYSLDTTFKAQISTDNQILEVVGQPDGKLLVGGNFNTYTNTETKGIVRLLPSGSVDSTFHTGSGFDGGTEKLSVLANGKILAAGRFDEYNGVPTHGIIRLHPDGRLDSSFVFDRGPENGTVLSFSIQEDGKIIAGGNKLMRLLPDGQLDPSFDPGYGPDGMIYRTAVQKDGKIIISGIFGAYNGTYSSHFARVLPTGSIDPSFNRLVLHQGFIFGIVIQPDGKLVVGGNFILNENPFLYKVLLTRLNENGTLDTTFSTSTGYEVVTDLKSQPDGQLLVFGSFRSIGDVGRNYIARVNNSVLPVNLTSQSLDDKSSHSLFPNPNGGEFRIQDSQGGTFQLLNAQGLVIHSITLAKGKNILVPDLHLENGVYFLRGLDKPFPNYRFSVLK